MRIIDIIEIVLFVVLLIYNIIKKNKYIINIFSLALLIIFTLLCNIEPLTNKEESFVGINTWIFGVYSFVLMTIAIVLFIQNRKYSKYFYNLVLIFIINGIVLQAIRPYSGGLMLEEDRLIKHNLDSYLNYLILLGLETNVFFATMVGGLKKYQTQEDENGGKDYD